MYNVRVGQWETNSSSIHQLVISLVGDKVEYPKEMTIFYTEDIVTKNDHRLEKYIKEGKTFAEVKLSYVFSTLLCDDDHDDGTSSFFHVMEMIDLFAEHGIKLIIDKESFYLNGDKDAFNGVDSVLIIQDAFVDMIIEKKWDLLSAFIFNDDSCVLQEWDWEEESRFYDEGKINKDEMLLVTEEWD